MTMDSKLIERSQLPPRVKKLRKRIEKALEGYYVDECAMALLGQYSDVLLQGCEDFAQHQRNLKTFVSVLDANARHYFKVNN